MAQTFDNFLASTQANIPVFSFIINILLSAILAFILSKIYEKYGNSLSNRREFGKTFLLITVTTTLIISVVKSSLALSLGLVGALSVIRFRAAIKEPEELAYLFLAIAIGLGFGADQGAITLIAFVMISVLVMIVKKYTSNSHEDQNLFLTIRSEKPGSIEIEDVVATLTKYCDAVDLRRLDESNSVLEAAFMVEARNFEQMNLAKKELQKLNNTITIQYLDNRGLL
jgi:hypothetical protein